MVSNAIDLINNNGKYTLGYRTLIIGYNAKHNISRYKYTYIKELFRGEDH